MKDFQWLPEPRPGSLLFSLSFLAVLLLQGCTANGTKVSDPDTVAPTAPAGLAATAASATQVNLSWTASTDNVGVTGYYVERCTGNLCTAFAQAAMTTVTSYSDTGLLGNTSYGFRVRATDAAGNLSSDSNISYVTTPKAADTTPPTTPANLVATAASGTQIGLTWTASTDNVGVTGYLVFRCSGSGCSNFSKVATATANNYSDSGLTSAVSYRYEVQATDAAGNLSTDSNIASATTPDTIPPTAPANLVAAASDTQIGLTWTASTDNVGVTGYSIYRCSGAGCTTFGKIGTSASTAYTDTGVTSGVSYRYQVRAADAANNISNPSNTVSAATSDTIPPSTPGNLVAAAASGTQIGLTWTASTDNVGVTGYLIYRCAGVGCTTFAKIATSVTATYTDTGLTSATSYTYKVQATDAAGNLSSFSNTASAITPDTIAPTAPTNLLATASSSSQIGLTWTASTDNVGVTGYLIYRCSGAGCTTFSKVGTSAIASFTDTGLTASTSYSYKVQATDAAANLSGFSSIASATTGSSGGSSITVSVAPRRGGLTTSQTLPVTATLTNDSTNAGVVWSFTSTGSASGGGFAPTTSTSGNVVTFTAPAAPGLATITATSVADGSKLATATVGITDLAGVTTYLNGISRQGGNLQEYALATSGATAVNSTNFGKLFSCAVDAAVYAQPLWVANVSISGAAHNVVYVATQHNTLYALDADSASCTSVWGGAKNLNPSGQTWVTSGDAGCGDLAPDIGIVSTPVIDLSSNTIYVVTKSKTTSGTTTFHQKLHALDLATGAEKFSGPKEISATASGTGSGSSGGVLTFDPLIGNQRPALLLENGHIIITWASHCDAGAYTGWVMSYSASTLAQEAVLNVAPNGIRAGIWMSGNGPAADSSGNIYFATGNGTFDANSGSSPNNDYGDSIMKLAPPSAGTFAVLSYFTPDDQASLNAGDTDQGSGGLLLLPSVTAGSYLVQAGKDGNIYLADRVNGLGGYHSSTNNVVQELSGQIPGGMWGSPTYWNGNVYFGPASDGGSGATLRAFSFDNTASGLLSTLLTSKTAHTFNFPGPTAPVSSSGTSNGIVWALDNSQWGSGCASTSSCQYLYAYDAANLATLLYSNGGQNTGSGAVKFAVPTVANGKVYVGGQNTLTVYGLLP